MIKVWSDEAWSEYLYWQTQDRKTLKRINQLLQDIDRNGYDGIGKPELLRSPDPYPQESGLDSAMQFQ